MGARQRLGTAVARRWKFVAFFGLLGALVAVAGFVLVIRDGSDGGDTAAIPAAAAAAPVPGGGQEFDGCRFVGHSDAYEILRGSVRPVPKPTEHPAAATCVWEVADPANPRSLQLSVYRGHEFFRPEGFEDDPSFEAVEGVGDQAFFVAGPAVQIHVRAGDHSVVLSVDGFEGEEPLDGETVKGQLVTLAGRVASWL